MIKAALILSAVLTLSCSHPSAATDWDANKLERGCWDSGWRPITVETAGLTRKLLWKGPTGPWTGGAIVVLHGGGGTAAHFCAGGRLVQPQIEFAKAALARGFAVFALESTHDAVTDAMGRACRKRFDFSVLPRPNIDLPFIKSVITNSIPAKRPGGSNNAVFIAGLSSGGFMTARAGTELSALVTGFAVLSAGDPYSTDTICDPSLSPRTSAIGILVDRETGDEIGDEGGCAADSYPKESTWPIKDKSQTQPIFRQFHHVDDPLVDVSCMEKFSTLLVQHGFTGYKPFIIPSEGRENILRHLWLGRYNTPLLDFFSDVSKTSPQ